MQSLNALILAVISVCGIWTVTDIDGTFATPSVAPGPYSLNVHFIPPLVAGQCALGNFWNPPNMTCAMCFCFTGRLSRCVPTPGCDPNNSTMTGNSTTTTTTTPVPTATGPNNNPGSSTEPTTGGGQGGQPDGPTGGSNPSPGPENGGTDVADTGNANGTRKRNPKFNNLKA